MQHARDRVRELTAKRRLLLPVEAVVQDGNLFLRGWVGYFKYGHSAERLSKIRYYVRMRIALFISNGTAAADTSACGRYSTTLRTSTA